MSILKAELKQLVTHEIGVRIDDALEAAKRELSVLDGKHAAFTDGAKAIEALQAMVDKDVEEEVFDLKTAAVVKKYVTRGVNALQNLAQQASLHKIGQTGKVQGFEHTISLLKGIFEAEKAKAEQLRASADEEGRPRELRSIRQRRQEEAAAEAAAAPEAASSEAPSEAPAQAQAQGE